MRTLKRIIVATSFSFSRSSLFMSFSSYTCEPHPWFGRNHSEMFNNLDSNSLLNNNSLQHIHLSFILLTSHISAVQLKRLKSVPKPNQSSLSHCWQLGLLQFLLHYWKAGQFCCLCRHCTNTLANKGSREAEGKRLLRVGTVKPLLKKNVARCTHVSSVGTGPYTGCIVQCSSNSFPCTCFCLVG